MKVFVGTSCVGQFGHGLAGGETTGGETPGGEVSGDEATVVGTSGGHWIVGTAVAAAGVGASAPAAGIAAVFAQVATTTLASARVLMSLPFVRPRMTRQSTSPVSVRSQTAFDRPRASNAPYRQQPIAVECVLL